MIKEVNIIRKIIKYIFTIVLLTSVIMCSYAEASGSTPSAGMIDTAGGMLNIRSAASSKSGIIGKLSDGSYITIHKIYGNWYYIEYAKDQYGWCHSAYIASIYSSPRKVNLSSGNLNVRSGAGTNYAKTGTVAKSETVLVLSSSAYWSRILYDGNKIGWVYNPYLSPISIQSTSSITLNVPSYKQYDSRWAGIKIGSYGKTMAQIGCATTALAMMESYRSGSTISPADMTYRVGYTSSGSIYWPENYAQITSSSGYLSKIHSLLNSGKPAMLGMKNSSGGQHWVVIYGYKSSDISAENFLIYDPGSDSRTNLQQFISSYPNFYKLMHY